MDVREKLVELLFKCTQKNIKLEWRGEKIEVAISQGNIADYLIANGVTVQEWISVKDRLPEQYHSVIVWTSNKELGEAEHDGKQFRWAYGDECANATHWMPLPQPPKGE